MRKAEKPTAIVFVTGTQRKAEVFVDNFPGMRYAGRVTDPYGWDPEKVLLNGDTGIPVICASFPSQEEPSFFVAEQLPRTKIESVWEDLRALADRLPGDYVAVAGDTYLTTFGNPFVQHQRSAFGSGSPPLDVITEMAYRTLVVSGMKNRDLACLVMYSSMARSHVSRRGSGPCLTTRDSIFIEIGVTLEQLYEALKYAYKSSGCYAHQAGGCLDIYGLALAARQGILEDAVFQIEGFPVSDITPEGMKRLNLFCRASIGAEKNGLLDEAIKSRQRVNINYHNSRIAPMLVQ